MSGAAFPTIDDLRSQLGARPQNAPTADYAAKMLHSIPEAEVVDRERFILDYCRGKRVLEFGASGPLHEAIVKVASEFWGIDRVEAPHVMAFDLDDVGQQHLPTEFPPEVIVCGEVLEHLGNPLWFLTRLRRQFGETPTIITVPNAFGAVAARRITEGTENVNVDHVAWYSYRTLKTLLGRAGYRSFGFAWYRGNPLTAEGLVVVCEG